MSSLAFCISRLFPAHRLPNSASRSALSLIDSSNDFNVSSPRSSDSCIVESVFDIRNDVSNDMSDDWRDRADRLWHPVIGKTSETRIVDEDVIENLVAKFWNGELPTQVEMKYVIEVATKVLSAEPNVVELKGPMTVCGDVHGQFEDLLVIFEMCGLPPYTKFLFLGDYVDRGSRSIEVIMLLLILKIKFRDTFYVLRGNHESMAVTHSYGFRQEILLKYRTESLWKAFEQVFNAMPIAATVNSRVFCVHGGISEEAMSLSEIETVNRFSDVPTTGVICDLLWSDPCDEMTRFMDSRRNMGHRFGSAAVEEFLDRNNMKLIVRAHQDISDGYEYTHGNRVLTVFSAPNYPPLGVNKGAVVVLDENAEPHPIRFKHISCVEMGELVNPIVY